MDVAKDELHGDWTMHCLGMYDGMLGTPCLKYVLIDIHFFSHSVGLKCDCHCIRFLHYSHHVSHSISFLHPQTHLRTHWTTRRTKIGM